MSANVQGRVSETILQGVREVTLGGRTYRVAPPSIGTLILASAKIAELPEDFDVEEGREKQDIIAQAKDYGVIPEIMAVLILGARKIAQEGDGRLAAYRKSRRYARLVREIQDSASPSELKDVIVPMLDSLQLKDFFVVTTFLQGINVTRPTKVETQTEAIASGQ